MEQVVESVEKELKSFKNEVVDLKKTLKETKESLTQLLLHEQQSGCRLVDQEDLHGGGRKRARFDPPTPSTSKSGKATKLVSTATLAATKITRPDYQGLKKSPLTQLINENNAVKSSLGPEIPIIIIGDDDESSTVAFYCNISHKTVKVMLKHTIY